MLSADVLIGHRGRNRIREVDTGCLMGMNSTDSLMSTATGNRAHD